MSCRPAGDVIAIVDDEAAVRAGLERLVRSRGYAVVSCASGSDFLRSLDRELPDCLLLDLHMPRVSGFDVLQELRKRALAIPVIVVTANAADHVAERVKALGAVACLDKPIDASILFDAISTALSRAR